MTAYEASEYRSYLHALCKAGPRGVQAALARAAACQASYFSQVLKGSVHLTEDQMLGIAGHLELSEHETEHLLMLLRQEKAATPKLRAYLEGKIRKSKHEMRDLKNRVKATAGVPNEAVLGIYFSSWVPSAVHLLTSSPKFQTPREIANRLNLPEPQVLKCLRFLTENSLVAQEGHRWKFSSGSMHIPSTSLLQARSQLSRRELATRSIALDREQSLHFSSVFTIDSKEFEQIQAMALALVESSHKVIGASGTEKLACFCLDLFEVV